MCVCLCACVRVCVCVCVQSCVKASNFVMELVRAEKARRKDADTNLLLRYLLKEEGRRQTQTDANRYKLHVMVCEQDGEIRQGTNAKGR